MQLAQSKQKSLQRLEGRQSIKAGTSQLMAALNRKLLILHYIKIAADLVNQRILI